jgi:hypothetical protein
MCQRELVGVDGVRVEVTDDGAVDAVRVCGVLCALRWFSYYQVHRPLPAFEREASPLDE